MIKAASVLWRRLLLAFSVIVCYNIIDNYRKDCSAICGEKYYGR